MSTLEANLSSDMIAEAPSRWISASVRLGTLLLIGALIGLPWLNTSCYLFGLVGYSWFIARAVGATLLQAAAESFFCGVLALGIAFHWAVHSIHGTTNLTFPQSFLVFVMLILWEGVAIGLVGLSGHLLARRSRFGLWGLIPVWITIESFWPKIFAWATSHSYMGFPPVLQVAELAGTAGVTTVIVVVIVALATLCHQPRHRRTQVHAFVAFLLVVITCVWGESRRRYWVSRNADSEHLRVACVQVSPRYTESHEQTKELSKTVNGQVDLILWPESTLGNYETTLTDFRDPDRTMDLSEMPNPVIEPYPDLDCDLLAGGRTYEPGGRFAGVYKNTAFLIDRSQSIIGRYVKRSLMPIGEYIPGEKWFPKLREWAALDAVIQRGTSDTPLRLSTGHNVGLLVCYEDMVAQHASSGVCEGAECLIALANGSAFKDADTLQQHLKLAQLRTIENRRALVRCAATGITCVVGPDGAVASQIPLGENGILVCRVPLERYLTIYTRFGEWLMWLSLGLTAMISIMFWWQPKPAGLENV